MMKQKQLSKSDVKEINSQLEKYNFQIEKKAKAMLIEEEGKEIVVIDKQPMFFYHEGKVVPTLKLLQENNFLKKVVIDMPAVKFIASGADVMRPGIKEVEDFNTGDAVAIVDEQNKKPLAVGIALYNSGEMRAMNSGKAIKNIHSVGDKIWGFKL